MSKRTIDEATARQLSVAAICDPRTIRKVLRGERVRGSAGQRAKEVLLKVGLLVEENQAA